jgi:glutamate-1-semialdehyde 2,1-aminomutase
VEAGSGVATLGIPGSPGVPNCFAAKTLSLPYNDTDAVSKVMREKGNDVACIIVEPVAGNMGLVTPMTGFLEALRDLTQKSGSMLIFDEVISGFRVAHGGAQALYGIMPDITTLGKIIGGGMPVGAYGGRREIMSQIAPEGPVYQAGTLSGNPLAMAAGIATLTELNRTGVYTALNENSERLEKGLRMAVEKSGLSAQVGRVGSILGLFFTDKPVYNIDDAKTSDLALFSKYYTEMRQSGVYFAPSQFESLFVSAAHKETHIDKTIETAERVMAELK